MPLYAKEAKKGRKSAAKHVLNADVAAGDRNPGSIHAEGVRAARDLNHARRELASLFSVMPKELYFVPSGTAGNNAAIFGYCENKPVGHIVTTVFEHPSVAEAVNELERRGWRVTRVAAGESGVIDVREIKKAIRPDTMLVSVMMVQNEIGTIQPIREIAKVVRAERMRRGGDRYATDSIMLHVDACQTIGWLPAAIRDLGADIVVWSGRKLQPSVNCGVLFVRRGIRLVPRLFGGGQEDGMWPGTENVEECIRMARGCARAESMRIKKEASVRVLRDRLIARVVSKIEGTVVNGSTKHRIANNLNFSFADVDGEIVVIGLDALGILSSTGSACSARAKNNSQNVRVTFAHDITARDIDNIVKALAFVVARARRYNDNR